METLKVGDKVKLVNFPTVKGIVTSIQECKHNKTVYTLFVDLPGIGHFLFLEHEVIKV